MMKVLMLIVYAKQKKKTSIVKNDKITKAIYKKQFL